MVEHTSTSKRYVVVQVIYLFIYLFIYYYFFLWGGGGVEFSSQFSFDFPLSQI